MEKLSLWIRITRATTVALVMSVALFLPGIARAFDFSLYETNASGACEICDILQLPSGVIGGYVVLLENASGTLENRDSWDDVVIFGTDSIGGILQGANTSTAPYVQLLSDGCGTGIEGDISCFPSYATVTSFPHAAVFETGPPTVYNAGNIYYIYSDVAETDGVGVPEPGSLLLLGSGLVGLGLWGRNRFKAVKA